MKSIKPGRGPSALSGISSIFAALFGVLWTMLASQFGAPTVFCLFGVLFAVLAAGIGIYNLINATQKNRFSSVDIVDEQEEPDPLNQRFGPESQPPRYCALCGAKLPVKANFCPNCGEKQTGE